jgi:hypothetical protein
LLAQHTERGKSKKIQEEKMKGLRVFSIVFLLTMFAVTGLAYAEEVSTSGYASVDGMSNYVWRGQKLSNSWVLQPSVGITYGSFDTNIWANYDSDQYEADSSDDGHGELNETDITLSYSMGMDKWSFAGGYIYYALDGANDTQELFLTIGYDILLNPELTVYYDYDEGNGAFIVTSIGHSIDLSEAIALNLGASASYNINNEVMGYDEDGDDFSNFYNAELSASVDIPVTKAVSVSPMLAYSFPISDDAEDAIESISDDGDKDILYGGLNVTLSF